MFSSLSGPEGRSDETEMDRENQMKEMFVMCCGCVGGRWKQTAVKPEQEMEPNQLCRCLLLTGPPSGGNSLAAVACQESSRVCVCVQQSDNIPLLYPLDSSGTELACWRPLLLVTDRKSVQFMLHSHVWRGNERNRSSGHVDTGKEKWRKNVFSFVLRKLPASFPGFSFAEQHKVSHTCLWD